MQLIKPTMGPEYTISVIKADIGGFVGHSESHPEVLELARVLLGQAMAKGLLLDYRVQHCGDDMFLIMTHNRGEDSSDIHGLAWNTFVAAANKAGELKLYGVGQDLIGDAFSGNVKGMGPGSAEMTIIERPSEPIIVFMADKTSAGAFNLPLYRMFADPMNTPGLVIAGGLRPGFTFEIHDQQKHRWIKFDMKTQREECLAHIGAPGRYGVKRVFNNSTGLIGASSSLDKLTFVAGKYVGKDDPTMIVRCQGDFPAVGEVIEPFTKVQIVEGWMRGSHHGPLMPVSEANSHPSRFDGPPRVVALGFQMAEGKFVGPRDMFDDPGFDHVRMRVNETADMLRDHGPFEPHRLGLEDMEYTQMAEIGEVLEGKWQSFADTAKPEIRGDAGEDAD